jgi:lipoprotein-releasing system permease protein
MLLTIDPHIRITPFDSSKQFLIKDLANYQDLLSIEKGASSKIIVGFSDKTQAGILITRNQNKPDSIYSNKISIGIGLADKLDVRKGDTIRISTPEMIDIAITGMMLPQYHECIIDSIFQISSGVQYDNSYIICDYAFYQKHSLSGNQFLDIRIRNIDNVNSVKEKLQSHPLLKTSRIETWKELHQELYATMEFERNMSFIILGIITFVSAFNILIAMWMTVKAKRKDIATLLSMGIDRQRIQLTFIFQGLIIGVTGTLIGVIVGITLCLGQHYYEWIQLPNSIVKAMPVSLQWEVVLMTSVFGIVVSLIAGIYPSKLAMNTNISEELRQD